GFPDAKTEYLFEAYLYMGFVLTRQNAPLYEVNAAFEQAVKMDPKRQLDELVIPPDLTEKFNAVRDQLVGCLYVTTEPIDANLMVVQNDSIVFNMATPTVLCELVNRNYQLLLTKEDYEEQFMPLNLTAGTTDTLFVTLKPSLSSSKQKKGKKSAWGWVARGGIVAAAAAVLYKTVVEGGDENLEELPAPPDRPSQ
ncbi:hypothetical protein GWO43_27545, partial [candidate division KSB1 bacterium]|nr:hypothetical protein [candidate division KSB1 bacterium]NIR70583.1 hypothetical protein [candidate division KSB1 bacterium]NIS27719.1 hypothetical protein [candidate division KSB1 bacterium]NIT74547.1 hypothetical protein [candidate division KSB1 bacterium]NIU28372.1 hypothetical protein [candidate division KSB1 bacterium]